MLACRNEERVCRALWPNGFPDSLGGDCYHIEVHSSVSVHSGWKSEFVNYIRVCPIRLDIFRYFQTCSDLFSSVMLCFDTFIQEVPAFRDFRIRDPRYFVIWFQALNSWNPHYFVILKVKIIFFWKCYENANSTHALFFSSAIFFLWSYNLPALHTINGPSLVGLLIKL